MSDKRLLEVLKKALRAERDGLEFYGAAAARTDDEGAREVFGHLAEEEKRHFAALQREYRALLDGAGWDASVILGTPWTPSIASSIFSERFRERIGERHLEMSALSIGILLERDAERFYRTAAESERDDAIRGFLLELAEWEAGHLRMLSREDEALRDAYWHASRFAPLL